MRLLDTNILSKIVRYRAGRGLVMVTRNIRHFELVSGLKLENWFDPESP
ncbi:MAG: hypothetical protein ACNA7J_08550 [Wenzhouxiangella sp.]